MKTDWVAEVFSAMRDCGENISIVYGRKPMASDKAEPTWFELPHDQYDGMSGLAAVLRRLGCRIERLPVLQGDRFTFLRALRGLYAALPLLGNKQRHWQRFDGTRNAEFAPVGERMAWDLFTEGETREIVLEARAAGVTVNTYLLFHLDAVIGAGLTRPDTCRLWMIPVNLRGAVRRDREAAPHMSFWAVDLDPNVSLAGLQAQISRLKQRAYHWGTWILLHAGALLGIEGMRRDIRRREKKNHGWTGIFSNLGVWEVPDAGHWIFGPAISRVHPVGAGCITMNGRMALTLQLHAAFGAGSPTAQALLRDWKNACLQQHSTLPQAVAYG